MKKKLSVLCLVLIMCGRLFSQNHATDSIVSLVKTTDEKVKTEWAKTIDVINQRNALAEKLITSIDLVTNQQCKPTKELAASLDAFKLLNSSDEILIDKVLFKAFALQLEEIRKNIGMVFSYVNENNINNTTLQDIQAGLEGSENRVTVQCQKFNQSAFSYNRIINHATLDFSEKYPILCKKKCYFEATNSHREEAPKVNF